MPQFNNRDSASGIGLIRTEMKRQHANAMASLDAAVELAGRIASSIRLTGRLVLIGMGGSHCMNRTAEALYRAHGIDAIAVTASEQLYQPLPVLENCTRILVSQSGESAEIVRLLPRAGAGDGCFGLTLDGNSRLARSVPCLVGIGGPEKAYAATRSLLITLALHAAVLEALGEAQDDSRAVLKNPPGPSVMAALAPLAETRSIVFSGRASLVGVAEAGALGLLELARMPGFAIEGGQFRHGPIEALSSEIGVVLLRADCAAAQLSEGLAAICIGAGITPVVFDASGRDAMPGCVTIRLPRLCGLAAVVAILPPLQTLLLELAQTRVENPGVPIRAQKITDME